MKLGGCFPSGHMPAALCQAFLQVSIVPEAKKYLQKVPPQQALFLDSPSPALLQVSQLASQSQGLPPMSPPLCGLRAFLSMAQVQTLSLWLTTVPHPCSEPEC